MSNNIETAQGFLKNFFLVNDIDGEQREQIIEALEQMGSYSGYEGEWAPGVSNDKGARRRPCSLGTGGQMATLILFLLALLYLYAGKTRHPREREEHEHWYENDDWN